MAEVMDRSMELGAFVPQPDDGLVICRCEEITKGEIRRAVHDGIRNLTEIKRYLRAGMGLCQGLTCARLVRNIVAKELGVSPLEMELTSPRSPARPVEMRVFANEKR